MTLLTSVTHGRLGVASSPARMESGQGDSPMGGLSGLARSIQGAFTAYVHVPCGQDYWPHFTTGAAGKGHSAEGPGGDMLW